MHSRTPLVIAAACSAAACLPALSHGQVEPLSPASEVLQETVIEGKAEDLLGVAAAASKGQSSAEELQQRPFLRRGELLEVVPGMIVTQHSGTGKANQYFVRGFNLDHGTDFGVYVDGMPVNQRTHGHGQGYADINFLIPELVEELEYFKGPYYAQLGDFSSAGTARFRLYNELPEGIALFSAGQDSYYRALLADSFRAGPGTLTFGLEFNHYDGPWVREENGRSYNGLIRYFQGDEDQSFSVTGMAYDGDWDSTDQIPQRLIRNGTIDRLGFVDPTVGGDSRRYSLSFDWRRRDAQGSTIANAYLGSYELDLFSNFTYFLDDPVDGDQFNQVDDRIFAGGSVARIWDLALFGRDSTFTLGFQTHHDWIDDVALHHTKARRRLDTTRQDEVYETSLSLFGMSDLRFTDWFRAEAGLRGDLYYFDVDSELEANSGNEWDGIVSPKLSLIFGPWHETEYYLNFGAGFHSNDARGVTIEVDPSTGERAQPVDPLVRTWGFEFGTRTQIVPDLTATLALFYLESDSELLFVGDAGNTEAGPSTRRYGVEAAAYWRPLDWFTLDAELALANARFKSSEGGGKQIPNSVPAMFSGGLTLGREQGPFASIRARFFSERPLVENDDVESDPSFVVNARAGYRLQDFEFALEVLNLFDSEDNDIEYFYTSRTPGEALAGIDDIHLHPLEPRTFRFSVSYRF